jgi:glutathione-independent formaldehyde dehydrogenase
VDPLVGSLPEQLDQILGVPEVDAAVDCVGFEAKGHHDGTEQNAAVLNQAMEVTRAAGAIGIPGLYVTEDPGAKDEAARHGSVSLRFGIGWAKSLSFATGQTPTMQYNRLLREAILHDRVHIARNVNATVLPLVEAPRGYEEFDHGEPKKFVLDPHGLLGTA